MANGRKPTFTHHLQLEAIKSLKAGKETQGEIARSYNVSRWMISRLESEIARTNERRQ